MQTHHRKLDRSDFYRRSLKVDATTGFGWRGLLADPEPRAFRLMIYGFVWAGFCLLLAAHRTEVEEFFATGFSPNTQFWLMSGCAAFLAYSLVTYAAHALRMIVMPGVRRSNSFGLMLGVALAFGLTFVPQDIWVDMVAQLDVQMERYLEGSTPEQQSALPALDDIQITMLSSANE